MINIKGVFLTTGISLLFGVYSIYNVVEYLRLLNNLEKNENYFDYIKDDSSTKKYIELDSKYNILKKDYVELKINFDRLNEELNFLNVKIKDLNENKFYNIELEDNKILDTLLTNKKPINENIICDVTINLVCLKTKVHLETYRFSSEVNVIYNCTRSWHLLSELAAIRPLCVGLYLVSV